MPHNLACLSWPYNALLVTLKNHVVSATELALTVLLRSLITLQSFAKCWIRTLSNSGDRRTHCTGILHFSSRFRPLWKSLKLYIKLQMSSHQLHFLFFMDQTRPLFCLFLFFSHDKYSTNLTKMIKV